MTFSAVFHQTAVMVYITTLNELSQLGSSDFNQPDPRHGLRLLYWFAQEQNQLNPTSGAYGFRRFYNRIYDEQLLPNQNLPYYEVGNLNALGADKLPNYVRPHNHHFYNDYNKDRIIVGLNGGWIDRVYVTEHEDQTEFDSSRTYRVSQGLLDQIRWMDKEQFLKQMEQQRKLRFTNQNRFTNYSFQQSYTPRLQSYSNQQPEDNWSCCKLLLSLLLSLILILIVIPILLQAGGRSGR